MTSMRLQILLLVLRVHVKRLVGRVTASVIAELHEVLTSVVAELHEVLTSVIAELHEVLTSVVAELHEVRKENGLDLLRLF